MWRYRRYLDSFSDPSNTTVHTQKLQYVDASPQACYYADSDLARQSRKPALGTHSGRVARSFPADLRTRRSIPDDRKWGADWCGGNRGWLPFRHVGLGRFLCRLCLDRPPLRVGAQPARKYPRKWPRRSHGVSIRHSVSPALLSRAALARCLCGNCHGICPAFSRLARGSRNAAGIAIRPLRVGPRFSWF